MNIVLIPGLWLDGASWAQVIPGLEVGGHTAIPITLPGMEAKEADRSAVTLDDCIGTVVAAIDACDPGSGATVVVAHSAGGGLAHAAADARADRVGRVVYVGGFPAGDGEAIAGGFTTENGDIPFPGWEVFEEADLVGLDERARRRLAETMLPSPACLATEKLQLSDQRRYQVPVTAVCTEYTGEQLRGWVEQDLEPVRELSKISEVEYVDLATGHWPQFSLPEALAEVIAERAR